MIKHNCFFLLTLIVVSCGQSDEFTYTPIAVPDDEVLPPPEPAISDTELLDLTQRETFKYFWDFAESNSGAARERYHPNEPSRDAQVVTSGGTGFG
ncbi:MAG: beta-glucosidase, partial [Bacteroidota bacterium]